MKLEFQFCSFSISLWKDDGRELNAYIRLEHNFLKEQVSIKNSTYDVLL